MNIVIAGVCRKRGSSQSNASSSSTISSKRIAEVIERLKSQRYHNTTRATYYKIWKLFGKFYAKLDIKLETWEDKILLFVGYLIDNNCKSSTVRSYVSALKGVLAESDIIIHEDRFLLSSLTRACRIQNDRVINRFPIYKQLLHLILDKIEEHFSETKEPYLETLFKAIFVASYYGLLRAGEVTQGPHVVLANNVFIGENKDKILFILRTSKTHGLGDKPQEIKFARCNEMDYNHNKKNGQRPTTSTALLQS